MYEDNKFTKVISDDEPPRAFLVFSKYGFSNDKDLYTDDANDVSIFMLARDLHEYVLAIYGRAYEWGNSADVREIEKHIIHCRNLDEAFYPLDEFPRHHWWE